MLQTIVTFGIFLSLIFLIGILINPLHEKRIKYLFTGLFLSKTPAVLWFFFYDHNNYMLEKSAAIIIASFTLPFLLGPCYYLLLGYIFGYRNNQTKINPIYFIPAGVSLIIIVTIIVIGKTNSFTIFISILLAFILILHHLIYNLLTLRTLYRMKKNINEERIGILMTAAHSVTFILMMMTFIFIGQKFYYNFFTFIFAYATIVDIISVILTNRYPRLYGLHGLSKSAVQDKKTLTERSLLPLDYNEIEKKLNDVFNIEKIYRVENLSLNMLANEIEIHPYQLTHYLGVRAGKNFNSLVNSYRIDEAKALLVESPDKTIISIAFETGFNSKSSFNRIFLKMTGMTPTEYRKKFITSSSLPALKAK